MNDTIFITGHRNPDSDSICSALAYANLKQILGENAIACRLGALNDETKYILKRFDVEGPFVLKDARSQLRDIQMDEPTCIKPGLTVAQAWNILYTVKNKSLFVVDDQNRLLGVVSTSNLSSTRSMNNEQLNRLMSHASIQAIAATISGEVIVDPENYQTNGRIFIVTLINGDAFKDDFKGSIAILSDGDDKQKQLIERGIKCLIITCSQKVSEANKQMARDNNCAIIHTDLDTMNVAKVIMESFPVEDIMSTNIVTCQDTEYVNDAATRLAQTRYRSYPVLNEFGHIVGAVSRFHLSNYARRRFILVDHSAKNQSIQNIDEATIEEIIDHHHIGNIETSYPIFFRNQKCGCTATIIAQMYYEKQVEPTREYAGLMLGAILSDTMNFKSKTTTQSDIDIATWLAQLAQVDINEYALGLLNASISLKESTPQNILNRDLKNYEIGRFKIAIGQTNFRNMEDIQTILPSFREHLEKEQSEKGLDLMIMMFSNIMAEGSMFVFCGPLSRIMNDLIETIIDEGSGYDSVIISRKQQLVPKLSNLLKMM